MIIPLIYSTHAVTPFVLGISRMRDPSLVEPRSASFLRVNPPHGRQTRVALGLEANGEGKSNGIAYSNPSMSCQNGNIRPVHEQDVSGDRQESSRSGIHQDEVTAFTAPEMAGAEQKSTSARPQALQRARSDFGPRHRGERNAAMVEEDLWRMRHGWEDEYTSSEYLAILNSVRP